MPVIRGLSPFRVEARLNLLKDLNSCKFNDLRKQTQDETRPGDFVHNGASRVAPIDICEESLSTAVC